MKLLLTCLATFMILPLSGAQAAPFSQVAEEIETNLAQAKAEQIQAQKEIAEKRKALSERLTALQDDIQNEKALLAKAQEDLEQTHKQRNELSQRLEAESSDIKELAGNVRAAARDLLNLAERSPITAEKPQRLPKLKTYLDKANYPGLKEIQSLIQMYQEEIQSLGKVLQRTGSLVDREGNQTQAQILRIGGFTTIYRAGEEVGFARTGPASGRLLAVSGEPSWLIRRNLNSFLDGEANELYLDITGGAALRQISRRVGLWEQLLSGGPLIWPILAVGLAALVLISERLLFLHRVRSNTDVLMGRVNQLVAKGDYDEAQAAAESQPNRPTSNIIKAGLALRGCSVEVVENGLSGAVLRELPRLERFLTALKVLAAVAPLLGLLGTVTGMINTFHVITIFGTGNPRLMAGGISEALVTTQLGLAVAIPILVASALLGRKAQSISDDMEEKAMAMSAALIGGEA
jgi:biopolymer transport protein ExbB